MTDLDTTALQRALAGRYSLDRELGRGGMGVVFLGRDVMLDRLVAIKVLPPHFGATPHVRERFLREARTAAQLQHPNIVPIHAVEEIDGWIVIAMGYIDGGTLADRIRQHGPLDPPDAIAILRDLAQALAYAHRRQVVHRDIKPENILLDRDSGRAVIADFGIAQHAEATSITDPAQLIGTPGFMSPEQVSGSPLDGRSDLYALGVVGYYALAGRLPFTGDARAVLAQHLTQPVPSLHDAAPTAPRPLLQAIERVLEKDRDHRFADGDAFAAALDAARPRSIELPKPLATWVGGPGSWTFARTVVAMPVAASVVLAVDLVVSGIGSSPILDAATLVTLVLPLPVFLARRMQLLRRAAAAGYRPADLSRALDDRAERRAAAAVPYRWLRVVGSALASAALGVIGWKLMTDPFSFANILAFTPIKALSAGFAVDAVMTAAAPRVRWLDAIRRRIWQSPLGAACYRVATLGVRRRLTPPADDHRGTEIALGSAIAALFDALPRREREQLADLPRTIALLEASARDQRRRLEAFDRDARADALPLRHQAEQRLRDAVSALEIVRLDLLRLHARTADVATISGDLQAAHDLSARIEREIDARDEVSRLLAPDTGG